MKDANDIWVEAQLQNEKREGRLPAAPCSAGYAADPTHRTDYKLAMEVLQSDLYQQRPEVRDLVDAILQECQPVVLA